MLGVPKGVAHVSFLGGGVFVPTRSPYDRQVLVELVADRAHSKGRVQVLVGDQRWMVHCSDAQRARTCSRCGTAEDVTCYSPSDRNTGYCVECAIKAAGPVGSHTETRRLAGQGH